MLFGLLFGFTYAIVTNNPNVALITGIAFVGVLIPNIDVNFMTRLSSTPVSMIANLFLIPLLVMLIIPGTYVSAFFIGYYGHVVNDLDGKPSSDGKNKHLDFAKQRALTGALWMLAIVLIMAIFKLNFNQTMRLFQTVYVL